MSKRGCAFLTVLAVLGALATGGCPVINPGSALMLQDWGRDLLTIPIAVIIGELIDEAQGTNVPLDRQALYDDLYADLSEDLRDDLVSSAGVSGNGDGSGQTSPGPAGPAGQDGQDGQDGAQGATGATGATGAQGPAGADGEDGEDGKDGKDLYAVAMGCVGNDGVPGRGYGFNARKVDEEGENGVYAVALIGYEFPENFDANDLVVLITPDAIVSQEIVTYFDPGVGYGFLVEFRDLRLQRVNTEFCFAVYDTSVDPYAD